MSKLNLLIVEDDIELSNMLRSFIEENMNVNVYQAFNFLDLKKMKIKHLDIAVVDLGLPPKENNHKEGIKVIKYLKSEFPNIKIIILTGQKSNDAPKDTIPEGIFDYLQKPASIEDIKKSISRAVFFQKYESFKNESSKKLKIEIEKNKGIKEAREMAEKSIIENILKDTNFNIYKTAKILGIKRELVYYYIKKFNIKRPTEK